MPRRNLFELAASVGLFGMRVCGGRCWQDLKGALGGASRAGRDGCAGSKSASGPNGPWGRRPALLGAVQPGTEGYDAHRALPWPLHTIILTCQGVRGPHGLPAVAQPLAF